MKTKNPVLIIIRDGWGYREQKEDNAIYQANTPNHDKYLKQYPNSLLDASGEAVGLLDGYQGNSEVGHITIGAGRIISQSMLRINKTIEDGSFFDIKELRQAILNCKENNSKLHIIGLLQTQGVHSHINHLFALIDLCRKEDFKDLYIHAILDGRDAPVTESIIQINSLLKKLEFGEIVTISGRYYAMDRDNRWDRIKKAYDCMIDGNADEFDNVLDQIKTCHENKETDEFIIPRKLKGYNGVNDKDSIMFFNFRTDRPRQLKKAIIENDFNEFERNKKDVYFVAMTQYYKSMNGEIAFENIEYKNLLGEYLSNKGYKQLRISETEKYAHVTFFFNGQIEDAYKNEDRILINSPRIDTYDLKPEMSVAEISDKLQEELKKKEYDFIVTNLVNCDMVGHTGKKESIIKAVESVDTAVGDIVDTAIKNGYTILVFADHGNAEDISEEWRTSHTTNPVPLILVSDNIKDIKNGGLSNIAPTVLDIMDIDIPEEMTQKSLLK